MPLFSIITPLHAPGNRFIEETYRSLTAQTLAGWEWIILENHGGRVPESVRSDPRVQVHGLDLEGVGALKRMLCGLAQRPWIVELDADDLLVPVALERIAGALQGGADFVYSDFAEFKDGTWDARWGDYPYGERFGWRSYPVTFEGHDLVAMRAPPITAQNLRLVEWTPNHVRAWTKSAYERVGGHDPWRALADDHDLVVRFYLAGCRFAYVEECLYFYRVHGQNTVSKKIAAIRAATAEVYNKYIWQLADKWAQDEKLLRVDLCGGIDSPSGYFALDRHIAPGASGQACDLEKAWPLEDGSVGLLRAQDAVEHLSDPIHTMNEAWRVLAPGGFFMIEVPSTNGQGAFCDPTHRSFWNRLSFRYYTDARFARYLPDFKGRFQVGRVIEWFPSDWHRAENVPYVEAHLFALKVGYRPMGEVLW
jgi:SAM-dependent methyltransferase